MSKVKDTEYLRISAKIKALENKLISNDTILKITDAPNVESAVRVLTDLGYGQADDDLSDHPVDFEKLLEYEQSNVYSMISKEVPEKQLIDIFRIPYDYMNIKACLKAEYAQVSPQSMLLKGGTISKDLIEVAVKERDNNILSSSMIKSIDESSEMAAKLQDPQIIDLVCDKYCYKDIFETAQSTKYQFAIEYVTKKIDLINISAFIRIKNIKKPWQFYEKVYIPCKDAISLSFFSEYYDQNLAAFGDALSSSRYTKLGEALSDGKNISTKIEKALTAELNSIVREFSLISFGPQIPFAYLIAKDMEIRNIRAAMVGKIAGIDADILKERLGIDHV